MYIIDYLGKWTLRDTSELPFVAAEISLSWALQAGSGPKEALPEG